MRYSGLLEQSFVEEICSSFSRICYPELWSGFQRGTSQTFVKLPRDEAFDCQCYRQLANLPSPRSGCQLANFSHNSPPLPHKREEKG